MLQDLLIDKIMQTLWRVQYERIARLTMELSIRRKLFVNCATLNLAYSGSCVRILNSKVESDYMLQLSTV